MEMDELKYWPDILSISPGDWSTKAEYKQAYKEAKKHYEFKVRFKGGWKFFTNFEDYLAYRMKKYLNRQ